MSPPSLFEPPVRTSRLLLAALLAASGCSAPGTVKSEPVVLGLAGPFEQEWGATVRMGAELARAQINEAGGIGSRRLEFHVVDDDGNPERALAVAQELFGDPSVVAVVGHATSGAMTAAAPVYGRGLAALATSATSPDVSRLGPWVFRVASSDSTNAVELARRAREMSRGIAILYANDDYGRGLSQSFRTALLAAGGRVVEVDPYLESTEDFTPYLARLKRKGVDWVFIAGLEAGASRIIEQARALGLGARFIGGDGLEGLVSMGPTYDGTLVGLLYHPDASPVAHAFAETFRARYGREPGSFAASSYDAVHLLAAAAEANGAERGSIRAYLEGVGRPGGTPPFEGTTGTIRFDSNGDPVDKGFAVGVIRGGTFELFGNSR